MNYIVWPSRFIQSRAYSVQRRVNTKVLLLVFSTCCSAGYQTCKQNKQHSTLNTHHSILYYTIQYYAMPYTILYTWNYSSRRFFNLFLSLHDLSIAYGGFSQNIRLYQISKKAFRVSSYLIAVSRIRKSASASAVTSTSTFTFTSTSNIIQTGHI
jgi:hypothetical protein